MFIKLQICNDGQTVCFSPEQLSDLLDELTYALTAGVVMPDENDLEPPFGELIEDDEAPADMELEAD